MASSLAPKRTDAINKSAEICQPNAYDLLLRAAFTYFFIRKMTPVGDARGLVFMLLPCVYTPDYESTLSAISLWKVVDNAMNLPQDQKTSQ